MAVIVTITIMFSLANICFIMIIRRVYVESVEHYVDDVIQHSIDVQVTTVLLPGVTKIHFRKRQCLINTFVPPATSKYIAPGSIDVADDDGDDRNDDDYDDDYDDVKGETPLPPALPCRAQHGRDDRTQMCHQVFHITTTRYHHRGPSCQ